MICHRCGHENPAEANFCSECGTALARPGEDATITLNALDLGDEQEEKEISTQLGELAAGDAMLVVTRGNNHGATYLLDADIVRAGRNTDSDVFLDDVTVSRKHAEFHRHENHYELHDKGSLNGTYVNGDRIDSITLKPNDEIQIGAFKLVFLTGPSGKQ
jgi:pSer/pThr/pTyr-binding forkhead associated (FHA) protein